MQICTRQQRHAHGSDSGGSYHRLRSLVKCGQLSKGAVSARIMRLMLASDNPGELAVLRAAARIRRQEELEIAKRLCLGLAKTAEFLLQNGHDGTAVDFTEKIGRIIRSYGLGSDREVLERFSAVKRACGMAGEGIPRHEEAGGPGPRPAERA